MHLGVLRSGNFDAVKLAKYMNMFMQFWMFTDHAKIEKISVSVHMLQPKVICCMSSAQHILRSDQHDLKYRNAHGCGS
jgi:hypothetical protein